MFVWYYVDKSKKKEKFFNEKIFISAVYIQTVSDTNHR